MTIYAVIGEDCDCERGGTVTVASSLYFDTAYSRCALAFGGGTSNFNYLKKTLPSAVSDFWITARFYVSSNTQSAAGVYALAFYSPDGVKRLAVETSGTLGILRISTYNAAGTRVTIATSSTVLDAGALVKFDLQVVGFGGDSGGVYLYQNGTMVASAAGVNLSTDSATTIGEFRVGTTGTSSANYYVSEIFVADFDTRSCRLVSLPVAALGNSAQWTGAASDVNETTLSDTTLNSSGTAGQRQNYTINSSKLSAQMAIRGVAVSARAVRGATGPQNIKLGIRTGGADYDGEAVDPGTAFSTVQQVYNTNPSTGAEFAVTQLTDAGFNLAMLSQA